MKRGGSIQRRTPLRATPPTPEERRAKQQAAADRARARRAERLAEGSIPPPLRSTPPPARSIPPKEQTRGARAGRGGDRSPPKPDLVTPDTRAEVAARSHGYCEARVAGRCAGTGQHVHHRKLRRHGDHRAVNLLHVCHACHDWIHRNVAESYEQRLLLRAHQDPATEPVRRAA